MSGRGAELAMRRQRLLLRSEQLREELAADQQVMLRALSVIDRTISTARKVAKPVALVGAGLLLFRLLRGRRAARISRAAIGRAGMTAGRGLMMRALFWLSLARRCLPYVSLARNLWRSRSSRRGGSYADAGAETEHLF